MDYKEFAKQANYKLRKIEEEKTKHFFSVKRLQQVMRENGAEVSDIFTKMNEIGLCDSEKRTTSVISGQRLPDIFELKAICMAVNVSADYLMGLSERVN